MKIQLAYFPGSGHAQISSLLYNAFGVKISDAPSTTTPWSFFDRTIPSIRASLPELQQVPPIEYVESDLNDKSKTIFVAEHPYSATQALNARVSNETGLEHCMGATVLGVTGYGSWAKHAQEWNPTKRANTIIIRLEQIQGEPHRVVDEIARFLELSTSQFVPPPYLSSRIVSDETKTVHCAISEDDQNLIGFLYNDQMKQFDYATAHTVDKTRALSRISEIGRLLFSSRLSERQIRLDQEHIKKLESRDHERLSQISQLTSKLSAALRRSDDLGRRNEALQKTNTETTEYLELLSHALAPRWKTILSLRPIRFILNQRSQIKKGTLRLDSSGMPVSENKVKEKTPREALPSAVNVDERSTLISPTIPSSYASYKPDRPLGIAVFAYDRGENVENVLESLSLQSALGHTHVWIDGDQGNPDKKKRLDETEARISHFGAKQVHRNRGNFGFRKMMIVAMRKMFEEYERVLFLEDDCFPTRYAIQGFGHELDLIENDTEILSVYGHPFLVDSEQHGSIGRFQGWGWASTRDKLMPLWPSLLDAYLMSEDEYRAFIAANLSQKILDHIDVTPGRQPSSTLPKFFAWDETLGFLAALNGMSHKATRERLIYNFGVGDASTHFNKIEHYRAPPFNMVTIDEIWQHF